MLSPDRGTGFGLISDYFRFVDGAETKRQMADPHDRRDCDELDASSKRFEYLE